MAQSDILVSPLNNDQDIEVSSFATCVTCRIKFQQTDMQNPQLLTGQKFSSIKVYRQTIRKNNLRKGNDISVSSCWLNSVRKMMIKSVKIHHPCKCHSDGKKGRPDAQRNQFFPRASSAPHPDALRQESKLFMFTGVLPQDHLNSPYVTPRKLINRQLTPQFISQLYSLRDKTYGPLILKNGGY